MHRFLYLLPVLILLVLGPSLAFAQQRRANIFKTTFNSHEQGFEFHSERYTSFYAQGGWRNQSGVRNTGSLVVKLGGMDNFLVDEIEGGFERYFQLPNDARDVKVSFSYNLTLSGGYESKEFSTVVVGIDGKKRHKVATLYGNSTNKNPATTGMQTVSFSFGKLERGTHRLFLTAFNNQKDRRNEKTRVVFDNVQLSRHTIRPNTNFVTILGTNFGNGQGQWSYADNTFRNTRRTGYSKGRFIRRGGFDRQGALRVQLGGVDNKLVRRMSGGWHRSFETPGNGDLSITLVYLLVQSAHYETNEVSQVLCSIDDELVGSEPKKDYVAQIRGDGNGGGRRVVGYNRVVLYKTDVAAGKHKITVGAFNNRKNGPHETTTVVITDVKIILDRKL